MTRNDPLVVRSAKQASSSAKGLEFGPSPKQKAQEKVKVENPCEKGATEEISATKTTITTKEEVPPQPKRRALVKRVPPTTLNRPQPPQPTPQPRRRSLVKRVLATAALVKRR